MAEKTNKLDSSFSLVGAFWTPDSADQKPDTGTLAADADHITLSTAPLYKELTDEDIKALFDAFQTHTIEKIETVHGHTAEGDCTLCGLFEAENPGYSDMRVNKSVVATVYRVSVCLMGMHIPGLREPCLDSARYTFCNWHQWLPRYVTETWEQDAVVIRVPTKPVEMASTQFENQPIQISMKLVPLMSTDKDTGGRLTQTGAFIEVKSSDKQSLDWYLQVAGRLENLFSLLTGTSLALDTMFVYRDEESGHVNQKRNSAPGEYDFQSAVRCDAAHLGNAMKIWLSESDRFESVEGLALGVLRKQKLFVETEFLSLAQALEGFHRATIESASPNKLVLRQARRAIADAIKEQPIDEALKKRICESVSIVNEPSLALRLADLCSRLSSEILAKMKLEPKAFISGVVFMRNYYTHAGGSQRRNKKPLGVRELFFLNQKMRALLRGVMLLRLELPENILVDPLVRDSTRWR
jgi:hypothetical protein